MFQSIVAGATAGSAYPGPSPTREVPHGHHVRTYSCAAVAPVFTEPERPALAGYTGLTREAYALDLRQYASWCQLDLLRTG